MALEHECDYLDVVLYVDKMLGLVPEEEEQKEEQKEEPQKEQADKARSETESGDQA